MTAVVDLDGREALDPALVGAKAAALAAARRRGLPVLEGFVVPTRPFAAAIDAAAQLVAVQGVYAAQLALSAAPLAVALEEAIRAAAAPLGAYFVCRSSSIAEGDSRWSGAFTSFLGIDLNELSTAVRGCVASVFRPEVAARLPRGLSFAEVAPAALVQRYLEPRCAGTARLGEEGRVEIVAVLGSPAPLLSGWSSGARAVVVGSAARGPAVELTGEATLLAVAGLFGALGSLPGTTVEWAATGTAEAETLHLLQVGPIVPPRSPRHAPRSDRPPLAPDVTPVALAATRTVVRYAGPLGERLMLPWSLAPGAPALERALVATGDCPNGAWALVRAHELAAQLNAQALSDHGGSGDELLDGLSARAGDAELRQLGALQSIDSALATELLECCARAAESLLRIGCLAPGEELWALDPADVRRAFALPSPGALRADPGALRRWQRLLQLALRSGGKRLVGERAAQGVVAGKLHAVSVGEPGRAFAAGSVLLLDRPLARYAPLLWRAAGLLCRSGSESAHLFEVARARRLPALLVRELDAPPRDGTLVLVDGDANELFVLPPADCGAVS